MKISQDNETINTDLFDKIMIGIIVFGLAILVLHFIAPSKSVNEETNVITTQGEKDLYEFNITFEDFLAEVNSLYSEIYNVDTGLLDKEDATVDEYNSLRFKGTVFIFEFYENEGEPILVTILVNDDTNNVCNLTIENASNEDVDVMSKCIEFASMTYSVLTGLTYESSQQIVEEAWVLLEQEDPEKPFVFYKNTMLLLTSTEGFCVSIAPAPDGAISDSHDISSMEFTE